MRLIILSLLLIVLALLLVACSSTYWYAKPGFDQSTFNRDIAHCRLVGRTPGNGATIYGRGYSYTERGPSGVDAGVMNDCMQAKGYSVSRHKP